MYAPEIIIISLLTTKKLNYKETSINSTGRKDMCVVMVLRVNNTNIFLNQQCVITNKETAEKNHKCLFSFPLCQLQAYAQGKPFTRTILATFINVSAN